MRTVLTLALLIAAGGVRAQTMLDASGDAVPHEILSSAVAGLSKELADPKSLQMRMLRYDRYRRVVCGEFNSRGPGGGFEAFRQFAATTAVTILVPPPGALLYEFHRQEVGRICP